jgi:hypothetical protein
MTIVFVVILLSTAMITRVIGDIDNVNLETKIEAARAMAQSGVSDALFQIDQQGATPATFCNQANNAQCTLTSVPGASGAVYTARWSSSNNAYTVYSKGTSRGVSYAVQATISRTPVLLNGVYGGSFVTFNGNSTTSLTVTDAYGNAVPGATAGIAVGPGGTLTCHGPSDPNAVYINYGGTVSGCTPYQNKGPVYSPQQPSQTCPAPINPYGAPPTPCLPSNAAACTTMGSGVAGTDTSGYVVTGLTKLEPGVYVCRGGLTMTGTVNVDYAQSPLQNNGRVTIYVFPPSGSSTSPNIDVSTATVNQCQTIGAGPNPPCNGGLVGDPTDLVIYAWGSGTASLGGGTADAIFWGPGMNLTMNGNSNPLNWTGSIILGGITANGHPSFNLNFDQRLQTEFDQASWQISNYLQTATTFSIP